MRILIVGGGSAGCVAATLLAKAGCQVSILARRQRKVFKAGESLPPVARPILERLNIWPLLQAGSHIPCPGNQSSFGSATLSEVDFFFTPNGTGWHLDRGEFEEQLQNQAALSGARFLWDQKLQNLNRDQQHWTVEIANTQSEFDHIIDASGASRAVSRRLGVRFTRKDRLSARIAVFNAKTQTPDHRTLVQTTQHGWWYTTALPHGKRAVMFFSDSDLAEFHFSKTAAGFQTLLQSANHIRDRLALEQVELSKVLSLTSEAAQSGALQSVSGRGWSAIGDAAMQFDPLSSQGLWTAFQSAELAAQAILNKQSSTALQNWSTQVFDEFWAARQNYYKAEQRWPNEPFWKRRHSEAASIKESTYSFV